MEYKISHLPPEGIYEKCRELWGVSFDNTIFTCGNVIHTKNELPEDILRHELVHVKQQTTIGKDIWWDRYFIDSAFRFEQELEAYRTQYSYLKSQVKDRNRLAWHLQTLGSYLSGKMYGNITSLSQAIKLIRND